MLLVVFGSTWRNSIVAPVLLRNPPFAGLADLLRPGADSRSPDWEEDTPHGGRVAGLTLRRSDPHRRQMRLLAFGARSAAGAPAISWRCWSPADRSGMAEATPDSAQLSAAQFVHDSATRARSSPRGQAFTILRGAIRVGARAQVEALLL
jgi:hypothetical protein